MPRQKFNDGGEITYQDLDKISAAIEKEFFDRVLYRMLQSKSDRVFGSDSFAVTRVSSTQVQVAAGLGIQYDNTQVDPEPMRRPLYLAAAVTKTIDAPDATNPRIDLVCIKHGRADVATASRKYKAPTTGTITDETLTIETDYAATVTLVTGTPAGSPVAPATPSGYIAIAQITVTALTGIAAVGTPITDLRSKLPVGGDILISTIGFSKLTAGAERTLDQLFTEIDSNLAGGGGAGGGLQWLATGATGAVQQEENGQMVAIFPDAVAATMSTVFMVPAGYVAGKQISMYLGFYSPSSSNGFVMQTTATLVRQNTDAMDSTTNQKVVTAAFTNTVAKAPRRGLFNLTDASGLINGVAVAPGDVIRVDLTRAYANGSDTDTAEVRFVPSATEPKLS
jgi:hypothetical protein